MTNTEYDSKLEKLRLEFEQNKRSLAIEYATSNNPYKVGDVISDHYKTIRIEKWKISLYSRYPSLVYTGVLLKKDGTPAKKQDDRTVWQSNINKK